MSWTRVLEFYGVKRPFNFKVAIPFLLNAVTLIGLFLVGVFLFFDKGLYIGTDRFYFFVYIACLLLVAAALSRVNTLSLAILCWCIIELGLAMANRDLRPRNITTEIDPDDYAFIYHPLLQLVPRPNWKYKNHPNLRGHEADARAGGIDIDAVQGKELDFSHNSLGRRGKEPTAEDLKKNLIFVYGGANTYHAGVTDGETWVEHLQSELNNRYTVLNLGIVGHSTEEHLIDTAFYQDIVRKRPVCSIYYVGWNDVVSAHLDTESAYADYHVLTMAIRRPDLSLSKYSPLLYIANETAKNRFDTVYKIPNVRGKQVPPGNDSRLESIFIEHVQTIKAINDARGEKTIFIGQIINKDFPKGPNIWAPLVKKGGFT